MLCSMTPGKVTDKLVQQYDQPSIKERMQLTPSNYRALSLISIPGKVFCKIILMRIDDNIDTHIGFKKNRGIVYAIFIV